jgi:type II secretory pathway component PulF
MMNKKAQEMSIQTVVVLILIMLVLVIVIAFVVPQLTGMFGSMGELGDATTDKVNSSILDSIPDGTTS